MTKDELFLNGSTYAPAHREDIVGIEPVLEQIDPVIYWLKNSLRFIARNSRLEPGMLFEGTPGTGKTLCARYIATEADALFINVRDWPSDGYVTAEDIREIFDRARQSYKTNKRPVILFWDEFEGYAQNRAVSSNSIKQNSVVSQVTSEMDGINGKCEGVLFIGCTNYKDNVDDALLRAGRMGIHIKFTAPDRKGKAKLLKHYLSRHNVNGNIDYESASYFFDEFESAAGVEEAAESIWTRAEMNSFMLEQRAVIDDKLIHSTLLKRMLGPSPPFMELISEAEYRVAIHEIGHALTAYSLEVPIRIITIQPGEQWFGRVYIHKPHEKISTARDIYKQLCVLIGSVCSEDIVGLDKSYGDKGDLSNATTLAIEYADNFYHSDEAGFLAFSAFGARSNNVSSPMSETLKEIYDQRVMNVMNHAKHVVNNIICAAGKDLIQTLAQQLVNDKTWTGRRFDELLQMRWNASGRPGNFPIYQEPIEGNVSYYR